MSDNSGSDSSEPIIRKARSVKGKTLLFRNVDLHDANFIFSLRTDREKSRFLGMVENDVNAQVSYLKAYASIDDQAYFMIEHDARPIGTVRLYDAKNNSFSWGSWILSDGSPGHAAIESTLMVYSYAVDVLGFKSAHFDVRKGNNRVLSYHERFGAIRVGETAADYLFKIDSAAIQAARKRYRKFLSEPVSVQ